MSHVQLPSSALERLVARGTFPLHTRTSVCRSLFGPVDHDARCRDATAKLREISERDRQRWNFNFDTYTPMAGVYEWEEAEETPAFYRETGVKRSPSSDRPDMDAPERLSAPESSAPSPVEVNRVDQLSSGTRTPVPSVKRNRAESADNTNITGQ